MNNDQIKVGKFLLVANWPAEMLPEVKAHLKTLASLIPGWCKEVIVNYAPGSKGIANIEVCFDYRTARLRVCREYFTQTKTHRLYCLRHEVLHLATSVPMLYAEQVFNELLPDGENDKLLNRVLIEMREKHEGCVEDLCAMFDAAAKT